jgi:hypothetical protein
MEQDEIKRIAKEAVKETLLSLGVATDEQESILALQQDMAWLRNQRNSTEEIAKWIRRGLITSALSGVLWILWEGFKLAVRS